MFRLIASAAVLVFLCLAARVEATDTDPDGALYLPSENALADVKMALGNAADNDRLALVVLGANWCHDSRALAARLHREPLATVIAEHYELVFVDVGFLDKGSDVLEPLKVAQFYATPTVLIVDPGSERVVNNEDRHIWGNAYSIDMASSVEYFEKWAVKGRDGEATPASGELEKLYAEIDQYEEQLAERVAGGYAIVGPMLAAYEAGSAPADFDAHWNELRDFRMAIPPAIQKLRGEAERRVAVGDEDVELEFPDFTRLSWERD